MKAHTLEKIPSGWRCTVCLWDWKQAPDSRCPGVPRVSADYLLTYTQLRKKSLKPPDRDKPDACYYRYSSKEFIWLYDERQALPRRKETEAQREGHKRAWATVQEQYRCPQCGRAPDSLAELSWFHKGGYLCVNCAEWQAYEDEQRQIDEDIERAHRETSQWAAEMLTRDDWVIIDTETTDLYGYLCEIAVIDSRGHILFHSLVNPKWRITPGARAVHGLSDKQLASAPTLPEIWSELWEAIGRRTLILSYNADFDQSTIERDARRYLLRMPAVEWECLMIAYAGWYGEYSDYWHDFKWQPLLGGDHSALGDARAALDLLQGMARAVDTTSESE